MPLLYVPDVQDTRHDIKPEIDTASRLCLLVEDRCDFWADVNSVVKLTQIIIT